MPCFEFQCPCGLRFEKILPLAASKSPQKCRACGEMVSREPPGDLAGSFNLPASGMGPQNTGVGSFDAYTDRVIGDHARQGWGKIRERQAKKVQALSRKPDKTNRDLTMLPDGDYDVLPPEAREVHERANRINELAMEEYHRLKKSKVGPPEPR